MKGNGNHGSKIPLNLQERKALPEQVVKSASHEERNLRDLRAGTPPTRWGMFNGAMPATQPAPPPSPSLLLPVSKAVRDPALAGGGIGDTVSRKRGPDGKFAQAQSAGPQTTATEDLANHEREARLAEKRYLKALGIEEEQPGTPPGPPAAGGGLGDAAPAVGGNPNMPPNNDTPPPQPPAGTGGPAAAGGPPMPQSSGPQLAKPQPPQPGMPPQQPGMPPQAGVPGAAPAPGGAGAPPGADPAQGMGQAGADQAGDPLAAMQMMPIGQTKAGMPIFDDPYNPAHSSFTPDQHREASQMHNQQAEMMTTSGRIPQALDHQMKAQIHNDLANDAQSPMERMMAQQTGGGANPMDQFLTQMGQQTPGDNNGLAGARPDQNKPLTPDAQSGPLPGMLNTHTGGKVGPQSQSQQHAGTVEQPQGMPPDPQGSSMPDVSGPVPGEMPGGAFDFRPEEFEDVDQSGEEATPGVGAEGAPPSNAGAVTQPGPDEGIKPTPGGTESEPPTDNPGPSVADNNPAAGEYDEDEMQAAGGDPVPPVGGESPDAASAEEEQYKKAFDSWLFTK